MGTDMRSWGSALKFKPGNDDKETASVVASIIRDGEYDQRLDIPTDCTWRELFAGFRQFLFTTDQPGVHSSNGYDDRYYDVRPLWNQLAPLLEDGSWYAYDVDTDEYFWVLVVENGALQEHRLEIDYSSPLFLNRGNAWKTAPRNEDMVALMAKRGVTLMGGVTVDFPEHYTDEDWPYTGRKQILGGYEKQYPGLPA